MDVDASMSQGRRSALPFYEDEKEEDGRGGKKGWLRYLLLRHLLGHVRKVTVSSPA